MSTLLVTDTSCLIALERIGHLELLPRLYTPVVAPAAVVREFGGCPAWLQMEHAGPEEDIAALLAQTLDRGEAEALVLARRRPPALLLIDEAQGRRVAVSLGLPIIGTAGVLVVAKQAGLIEAVKPVLDALIQTHDFRLAVRHYDTVLRKAGEA